MANVKNPFGKSDEIYGFQTLYREIGYYISRLENYNKSLKFFDEAIKKTPNDGRALIGRSRARAKASQYDGALDDVNKVLSLQPDDLVVLADKALNTYLCCEFEEGLVQNSRLLPKRQKPDNFSLGVMQCTDAIENCVGDRTGRPLRDHFKIVRKLAWKKNYAAHKPFEPKATGKSKRYSLKKLFPQENRQEPKQPKSFRAGKKIRTNKVDIRDSLTSKKSDDEPVPALTETFPFNPLQNYTSNIENYMAEKYLDSMYLDKIFLEQIQSASGANCPNSKGSMKIREIAKNCYKTVSYKQELLRTRRPFYFIKYQEAEVSGTLKNRQHLELEHQRGLIKKEADSILDRVLDAYQNKELKILLDLIEKLKRYCDSKPKKLLPDKTKYMNEIFDKVCKAFYEVYRLNEKHGLFQTNKRLYKLLGLPLSREASTDSVVNQFKDIFLNYKKEIAEFEQRLENAVLPEEICWYYHELSRFHLETKQFDLARVYARKCIQTARLINSQLWRFNSTMLMVKSNLQQHNKNDARNDILDAMKCVKLIKDEAKERFLGKCLEALEDIEFEDVFGTKELEKRENKIIKMMASSHMKDEVAHLFRQMSAMPPSRRMTVIPGVIVNEKKNAQNQKKRGMSILPATKESKLDFAYEPKIKKESKSDHKGNEFMNMVDFSM